MRFLLRVVALVTAIWVGGCGDKKIAGGNVDGAEIFSTACAACHGARGVPDPGMKARYGVKDLTSPALHERLSDTDIRKQVLEGSSNGKMPSFRGALTDPQLDALLRFVRGLRK